MCWWPQALRHAGIERHMRFVLGNGQQFFIQLCRLKRVQRQLLGDCGGQAEKQYTNEQKLHLRNPLC